MTLVVNYDMPTTKDGQPAFETYMHRIGRSGRFGLKGASFNMLYGRGEHSIDDQISRHFNKDIKTVPHDDDEPGVGPLGGRYGVRGEDRRRRR